MLMNCANDFHVLIDAPEILVLRFAHGVAESGADGIDENHVGFIEQGVGVVFDFVGRGRSGSGVGVDDAARTECAHVQPDGSRAGAAVVDEGDGALADVLDVAARVSGGIHQRGWLAFVVFQQCGGGGGFVGDGLAADVSGVVSGPGFFFGRVGVGGFCVAALASAAGLASLGGSCAAGRCVCHRGGTVLPHRWRRTFSFALRSIDFAPQLSPRILRSGVGASQTGGSIGAVCTEKGTTVEHR